MDRPSTCREENCHCIVRDTDDYDPDLPHSVECYGVRKGVIRGKEKTIENEPSDIYLMCFHSGSHSDEPGRKTIIFNQSDMELVIPTMFRFLHRSGILARVLHNVLPILSSDELGVLERELALMQRGPLEHRDWSIGVKFLDVQCATCGIPLFREDGWDYELTIHDKRLLDDHLDLDHEVGYFKAYRFEPCDERPNGWVHYGPYPIDMIYSGDV